MDKYENYDLVIAYAVSIMEGRKIACKELIQGCCRFIQDLDNQAYDFKPNDAEFVIRFIEQLCKHKQGEMLDGRRCLANHFC